MGPLMDIDSVVRSAESAEPTDEACLLISYLELRRHVGYLGFALPFVLALGAALVDRSGIHTSISAYYYSGMRNVFVGILCAIGVFLISYKGYTKAHDRWSTAAGVGSIGVALFPTTPAFGATTAQSIVGIVHLCFATMFFVSVAYISIKFFTQDSAGKPMTPSKARNNRVYIACGWTIAGAIALIALLNVVPKPMTAWSGWLDPVFWLESVAVVAFGVSWMTKGGVLSAVVRAILGTGRAGPALRT